MADQPPIGIDLGTTHSLVAVFTPTGPRLVRNAHGATLTPSIVGVLEGGEVVVGEAARQLALTEPERVVATFKRWMGTDRVVELAGQRFSAPALSSLVLRALKRDAEADLGVEIHNVVVTVPAYFNQHQRAATKRAGELAGLVVDRIVNEPTAAALSYGFDRRSDDKRLVVFDLGGGTFDVTVMEIFEGTLEILGTAGESRLGGEDFTEALMGEALGRLGRHLEVAELREPRLVARIRAEAERAKRQLGEGDVGRLRVPDSEGVLGPEHAVLEVSGARFEELVEPLLERLRRPTLRALRDAKLSVGAIDEVLLVGGATRMPVVRRLADDLFGQKPRAGVHPDEAVALGAAIQAALVADDAAVEDLVMTDVCPHTLGVEIVKEFGSRQVDGYFLPVIHRNTTIPVSREESVFTVNPGQTRIQVRVYQGESRRVEENALLGELDVKGLPGGDRGLEVILRFTYDPSGLLEVEAIVPSTGLRQAILLQQAATGLNEGDLRETHQKMQALKFYPREDLEHQRLLRFGNAALKEVSPALRGDVELALDRYEHWLMQNERQEFLAARAALLEALRAAGLGYGGDEA
ncbi:MAG: Hsp70 family protein [Planctomycetota bacterium]